MKHTSSTPRRPYKAQPPALLAHRIRAKDPDSVARLRGVIAHPRSLVRPGARWRPPSVTLAAPPGTPRSAQLSVAVYRHRLGNRARARVHGFSGIVPAYLITLRFTGTHADTDPAAAEAWVRALIPPKIADAVHEIHTGSAQTYCWFVDRDFTPVRSPASVLTSAQAA